MNETVRVLHLNGNKIGNKGGMAIAGALQVNIVLEEIDLAETDLVSGVCSLHIGIRNFTKHSMAWHRIA